MMHEMEQIRKRLFALQDPGYRDFQSKLMPELSKDVVIGIRTPQLRKLARDYSREEAATVFLEALPHTYYEENNLHGMLIEQIGDYDRCIEALDAFLPYVDNWATCDLISPKVLGRHRERLIVEIRRWMASEHTYTLRFGMEMLMRYYLDTDFRPEYLEWVAEVRTDSYYGKMMAAWFFATALAKQYEESVVYLEQHRLEPWVHNKTIQKAIESRRITAEQKAYLRTLKVK